MVRSQKGFPTHLTLERLLPVVYFHVLPPTAVLHKPPATIFADKWPVPSVGAHVTLQTLMCAHLLAAFGTLHTNVQTDWLILRFCVNWFMTQVRPLTPGSFETLPTVSAAQVPPPGHHRHAVPALTVILQVLQVLEAACTGWARVEPARRGGRMDFTYMHSKFDLGVKGAAADSAPVFGNEVHCAAREAFFQFVEILFLMDPLDVLLQEVQVSKGDGAVRTGKELR